MLREKSQILIQELFYCTFVVLFQGEVMRLIKQFFLSFGWGIIILILIIIPGDFIPHVHTFSEWLQWDKITHLILFGTFSFTILIGFSKYHPSVIRKKHYLFAFIISVLYGGLTECLQYVLDMGRDGNVYDFYANIVGAFLGCLLFFLYKKHTMNKVKSN